MTKKQETEMDVLEVYQGHRREEWYWRRQAANGQIIAVGGEAFTRREDAIRAARRAVSQEYREEFPDET